MQTTVIEPYLFFKGRCEEALSFYQSALGAEVPCIIRFNESPEPPSAPMPPDWGNKVMHSLMILGDSKVMASDGCGPESDFGGFSLSLNVSNEELAKQHFDALSEGGEVVCPLGATFFSPCFGSVTDKFGLNWMIIVPAEHQETSDIS